MADHNTEDSVKRLRRRVMLFEAYDIILEMILLSVIFLVVHYFFFAPFIVSGSSMEGSLHDSEIILVNRIGYSNIIGYHAANPQRGDVVVFRPPETENEYYIKRIIGVPGDELEFVNNQVYLNGTALQESYTNCRDLDDQTDKRPRCSYLGISNDLITVPDDHYFVMGDNRANSVDSRYCFQKSYTACSANHPTRFVPYDNIVGTATSVFWPFSNKAATTKRSTFFESFWPIDNLRGIPRLDPEYETAD